MQPSMNASQASPSDPSSPLHEAETARRFRYWQRRTIIMTMIGYALFYFVRKNFSLAMPGMEADLGISKTSLGLFLTLNGLIYGLSKFLCGMIGDRVNARYFMALGLALCAVANFAFGYGEDISTWITGERTGSQFTNTLILFLGLLWVLNGLLQGTGFPPCARLLTHWVSPKELATKMSIWNTSHSIGAGLVVILCGYIMGTMGSGAEHIGAWKWCFWIPSAIAFSGAIGLLLFLRDTPSSIGLPELPETERKNKDASPNTSKKELRQLFFEHVFANPLIWILSCASFFVYIVRFCILDWGPTLLSQSKGVSLEHAGWLVAMFEIAGILGMIVAGKVTDKYLNGKAHQTCVYCMAGAALFIFIFWQLPPSAPLWMLFASLCIAGFFIYGPQALVGIAAANQATKKAAATAIGFTGLFSYASTIVSGVGLGALAQHYGWRYVYIAMTGISIAGMLIFMSMWRAKGCGYDIE